MSVPEKESTAALAKRSVASMAQVPADTAVTGTPPPPLDKKKAKFLKHHKPAKLRISLPKISAYETDLEFQADAPGRVLVRLERLMGSDRVRITDSKYMTTLLKRLEEEEQTAWIKRTKQRKKIERDRYRQLAIEGYMEPGEDMKDLYQHPVFRVNRILNRLSKLDTAMSVAPSKKLPTITLTEPFDEYANTGILFGFHKNHYMRSQIEYQRSGFEAASTTDLMAKEKERQSRVRLARERVLAEIMEDSEWGGEDYPEELIDEILSNMDHHTESELKLEEGEPKAMGILRKGSLQGAQAHYGIRDDEMEDIWKPYQSTLIDILYEDEEDEAEEMFAFSKEVLGHYKRATARTEDFCNKVHRKLFQ